MDRRKELVQQYKKIKIEAGIYQIKNIKNQKVFVKSSIDLKTMTGKRVQLLGGVCKNKQLQEEWNQYGEEAFSFEVLEVLEEKTEGFFDKKDEFKRLEKKWLEKLQPYEDSGYNVQKIK
ncbi:MAG TPA: GIY-YIG nuclease family protein [Ruminiclostridium sp.]